ncbi:type II toxin-antitoxin system RelE/ParE family toxin [Pelagerythrobacter sp.]|uniref:type II toxin-antitoxin system RelE/ParE family toxin n=1 Tax=Pelagerythrobacter sp. TaxID=2800702 RepID=UPI0035B11668
MYLEDALADISEIGDYIAEDDPEQARRFVAGLREFIETIPENPRRFRLRSEWGESVRAANFGNYLIVFEYDDAAVYVLRVATGRRNIVALLSGTDR